MKRILFLFSWVVITATDTIIGFHSATSFGINETGFKILFSLGFALMSVPLKIIYERAVEQNYKKKYGGLVFGIFSVIWFIAFGFSLQGLGEYRVNNLIGTELENMKSVASYEFSENKIDTVSSKFSYRLAKQDLAQKSKLDSMKLVADFKLREKLMQTSAENSKNKDSKGFVFFSLLLVLSGAVCLHFGLETAESSQELAETSKKDIDELAKVVSSANENLESRAEVLEEMAEFYFCKSCQREFSKGGYTGHFRHHKTCEKGNFDIVKKPVKSKLSQLKLSL